MKASPAKLRSGEWGARVEGSPREGDTVTVTTRAGKSWPAKVTRVLWRGNGVALCMTKSLDRKPARREHREGGVCDECGQMSYHLVECHDSSGILGECCPRCAAGPSYQRSFA